MIQLLPKKCSGSLIVKLSRVVFDVRSSRLRAEVGIRMFYRARGGRNFRFAFSGRVIVEVVMAGTTNLQLDVGSRV